MAHPSIGIIGYGRFGGALATLAQNCGLSVCAWDPMAERVPARASVSSPEALCERAQLVVLAMPVAQLHSSLAALRPSLGSGHTVVDVGSVKSTPKEVFEELLGDEVPWVCTHPLFGPVSLARGQKPLRVVICSDGPHTAAQGLASSFFEELGCEIHHQTVEEHDRFMAETHALAFFVAKGLLDMGLSPHAALAPPSYQGMLHSVQAVQADAGHLFSTIQHQNPYAAEARKRFQGALSDIENQLEAGFSPNSEANLAIPQASAAIPNLAEERKLIDEVDRELLQLLQRRNRIALRAGRAKAAEGKPVKDPGREERLLKSRQAWAEEQGLDAGAIARLFETIMAQSRSAQRKEVSEPSPDGDKGTNRG